MNVRMYLCLVLLFLYVLTLSSTSRVQTKALENLCILKPELNRKSPGQLACKLMKCAELCALASDEDEGVTMSEVV